VTEGAGSPVLRRARLPHGLQVTGSNGGSRGPDWRRIAYLAGTRACSSGNGSRRLAQPSAVQLVGFHQPSNEVLQGCSFVLQRPLLQAACSLHNQHSPSWRAN